MKRLLTAAALLLGILPLLSPAAGIPQRAYKYRHTLVREARQVYGLEAPIAVFAAQIHQESAWRPNAKSWVGARGMAQFMPGTETWMNELFPELAQLGGAENPTWAIRAMLRYDAWLRQRVWGETEFDCWHGVMRGYNGGLGHWRMEAAKVAPKIDRASIDAACGSAKRHRSHCKENLSYPRRILITLQPRYLAWGAGGVRMTKLRMALTASGWVCALVVTIVAFFYGQDIGLVKCQASKVDAVQAGAEKQADKNKAAQAVGVKTAREQQRINADFRQIRGEYQDEKRKNPDRTGYVLDADSLRLWNAANAGQQPGGRAASKSDDRVRGAAAAEAGARRSGKPHRDNEHFSQLQGKSPRLD